MNAEAAIYTIDDARRMAFEAQESGARPRVHPNGFVQLDLIPDEIPETMSDEQWDASKKKGHSGASRRLHVWNPPGFELPHQGTVNEVHDHVFDMRSSVVRGVLIQKLYVFIPWNEMEADAGPRTHEIYQAVYEKKSSSRLDGPLEDGLLKLVESLWVTEGASYTQPAFTLHDSEAPGLVVTVMEKTEIHDGDPSVICPIGEAPDNDFDRATAAPAEYLWDAIEASLA